MSNNKPSTAAQLLALLLALAIACSSTTASAIRPSGARKQHGPRRLLLGGQKYFLALNETSGILLKPAKHQHRELGASTPPAAVVVKMQGAAAGPAPSRDAALSLKVNTNSSQQPLVVLELGRGSSNSAEGPAAAAVGSNQDLQQSAKQQLGGPASAASASSSSSSSSTEAKAAGAAASDAAAAVAAAPSPSNPVLLASRQRSQAMFTSGPGGYWYAPQTNSSSVPLGMPVSESGLPLTRWVMCAWGVSNFSSPLMLTSDAMVQAQTLINNFTSMAPGQVQLAAMANVTLSLSLSELPASTEAQLTPSLIAAASQWAGGFDPAYIVISYTQPDYGVPTPQFQAAGVERVTTRDQDMLLLPNTTSNSSSSSSSSSRRLLLLRGDVGAGRALAAAVGGSGEVPPNVRAVWVSYTRMAPLNASALQRRVAATCGVDRLTTGLMLDGTACAELLNAALVENGVPAQEGQPALEVTDEPMVSLAIRLAIGVTEAQAGAGTDKMLANWLAVPRNIRSAIAVSGVPDPIGPNALIRWLLPPEIWVSPPPPPPNPLSKPANAVGLALGAAAAVVLLAALLGFLLFRRGQAQHAAAAAAAAGDKYEVGSTASSRRRRRRHGKRRYLMPEAPAPLDPNAPSSSSAAAAAAAATAAAAAAAGGSSSDGGVGVGSSDSGDDVAMSPDQIRPAMRELGDSVTSAVRFEDEDEEAGEQPDGEGSSLNPGSGAATAAAAAPAGGSGGAPARGSGPASLGQRVLAAREALLAERQGSAGPAAAGAAAADGGGGISLSRLSSGGSNVGVGSSSSPARPSAGGWVEMGVMAAAGAGGATAAAAAAAGARQHQQPQQPRPRRLFSPFGTTQAQQQQQQQSPAHSVEQQGIAPVAGRAHSSPRSFELLTQAQEQQQHMPDGLVSHAPSVAAATAAATTQQQQQHPELPSPNSSSAAAGAAPGVPFKPRAMSPFAVAYDFTQLAGALPTQHSSSSCNSSSRANSGAGSATLQGHGRRSSSNEGAPLPQQLQPMVAAGRLQGVGSKTVAVAPDGSFTLTD